MKNIVALSTRGPNNLLTIIEFVKQHQDKVRLLHVYSDLKDSPSFSLAREHFIEHSHIPMRGGLSSHLAQKMRQDDCNILLSKLKKLEEEYGKISLIISAFRKILVGRIIDEYGGRLINVHPADLTVHDIKTKKRRYVGILGLERAILQDKNQESRTTIHYIDKGIDTGRIICTGPFVRLNKEETVEEFEKKQKIFSDKIALTNALHKVILDNEIGESYGV